MAEERKTYSRYFFVRGNQAMWAGDPAQKGSPYRQFVITSNEFNTTVGKFQVYGLQNVGGGIKEGKLAPADKEPTLLFDRDFDGLDAAAKKFQELVKDSEKRGFKAVTMMDILEFEARAKGAV